MYSRRSAFILFISMLDLWQMKIRKASPPSSWQKSDIETPEIQHRCLLKMSITMKNNSAARELTLADSLQGCMLINGVSNKPSKCLNKYQVKKGIPLKPRNKWPSKVLRHPPGLLVGKKKPLHERQKIIW